MTTVKTLFEKIIDQKEIDDFCYWAFGKNLLSIDRLIEFMEAWNQLHGDDLLLDRSGNPKHDSFKMVELWKKTKQQAS